MLTTLTKPTNRISSYVHGVEIALPEGQVEHLAVSRVPSGGHTIAEMFRSQAKHAEEWTKMRDTIYPAVCAIVKARWTTPMPEWNIPKIPAPEYPHFSVENALLPDCGERMQDSMTQANLLLVGHLLQYFSGLEPFYLGRFVKHSGTIFSYTFPTSETKEHFIPCGCGRRDCRETRKEWKTVTTLNRHQVIEGKVQKLDSLRSLWGFPARAHTLAKSLPAWIRSAVDYVEGTLVHQKSYVIDEQTVTEPPPHPTYRGDPCLVLGSYVLCGW